MHLENVCLESKYESRNEVGPIIPGFSENPSIFFKQLQFKKFWEIGAQIFREYLSVYNSLISGVFLCVRTQGSSGVRFVVRWDPNQSWPTAHRENEFDL